jgi:hypothetical protein
MHDDAAAHFSRAVQDVFRHTYHDRWIRRDGPTAWLPRSPYLNPLDIYLWRQKHLGMQLLLTTKEQFAIALWMHVRLSSTKPCVFERMQLSMMRLAEVCVESHGRHFGNLL